tara:strand:- start:288 stop:914 length:627 start_codon:yes stop_codon:yes gene_type:complete
MKKIIITQRVDKIDKINEVRNSLDIRWQELLLSIDLIPIVLPLNVAINNYIDSKVAGVILSGGNDLFSQSKDQLSKYRDKHEIDCIEYAINNSIPLIGICRGMQIIAEYFGSTLKKINGHVSEKHSFSSIKRKKYSNLFDGISEIKCFHNYAIDMLGDELEVVGKCIDDGMIEAIYHKKHKILGQMWHPERNKPFTLKNKKIIASFFN